MFMACPCIAPTLFGPVDSCHCLAEQSGFTALHSASTRGFADITSTLVKAGADVNHRTKVQLRVCCVRFYPAHCISVFSLGVQKGAYPLIVTAAEGFIECVQLLLKAGAQLECRNEVRAEYVYHVFVARSDVQSSRRPDQLPWPSPRTLTSPRSSRRFARRAPTLNRETM